MSRVVDRGAVFGGWVGLGMALVVAIAFELILAVQPIVFIAAPLMGVIIGVYANTRAERRRPRWRVMTNAAWAGLVTGIGLALIYVLLRLVFLYGDSGALPTGETLDCRTGPECTYLRYVESGQADDLAQVGVTDAASYEAAALREQLFGGLTLIGLTLGGALVGGAGRAISGVPAGSERDAGERVVRTPVG